MADMSAAMSVVDSFFPTAPLPPLLHNTSSLQASLKQGTLGVGYSGSGLLLFYFIGVSKVLQQLGVIKPGVTKIAATSGGIIGCAPDLGVVDHATFLKAGKDFVSRCRDANNCAGQLDSEVARVVDQLLPPNAAEIVNGTAFLTYSHPDERGVPVGGYSSTYASRDDLAMAIRAGCYLPLWSGPSMTRPFRGVRAYDGGFRRQLPCPPNVTYCVTVSVLPPFDYGAIAKSLFDPRTMAALGSAVASTLGSSPFSFLTGLVVANKDATYKMSEVVYGLVSYLAAVNPGPGVAIYPGKYSPNPYSFFEWILKMVIPPSPEEVDGIVSMGEADATA